MALAGIVIGGVLVSCKDQSRERKGEGLTLREHVWLECADLSGELMRNAETYGELAPSLEAKAPGTPDYNAVVDHLVRASIGYTREVRNAKLQAIQRRFAFCRTVRRITPEVFDNVSVRLDGLLEKASIRSLDGRTRSAKETVDALKELAELAKEVNELPLVE